jgi:hypothetical protein
MEKTLALMVAVPLWLAFTAAAQAQPPAPYPPPAQAVTPQVLGEMLRTATTFHDLAMNLNLRNSLGPDEHVLGPDGRYHHSVQRTAAAIGAGAGVGAAIGGMSRNPNGVLIGAIVGSAGGLIVDQILRHREETQARGAYYDPGPGAGNYPPDPVLKHRGDDRGYYGPDNGQPVGPPEPVSPPQRSVRKQ